MQSKGLIKFLAVLLVIVCVIQCSYMLPTNKVEKDADAYAQSLVDAAKDGVDTYSLKKSARIAYLDSISSEEIFRIPLVKSYTYDDLKKQQLALGLDLKGGMGAVLQVDLKEMLRTLSNDTQDPTFLNALSEADKALTSSQSDYITLFGDAFLKNPEGKSLARFFYKNLSEDINIKSGDNEVIRVLRAKANETVGLTFNLLKQRIDRLGVVQPNISLDAARDMILVELPGIDNPERAHKMLEASARLEFWDVYRISDANIQGAFIQADAILKNEESGESTDLTEEISAVQYDTIWNEVIDSTGNTTQDSTFELIEKAVDPLANQGPLFKLFSLNGANGAASRGLPVLGMADKNKQDAVMALLNKPNIRALFPKDGEFRWGQNAALDLDTRQPTKQYELYMIKKKPGVSTPPLEGDHVTSASQAPDPTTGEIQVSLNMDPKGAKIWADMTTRAAQDNNREIAIVLDDKVISSPSVRNPITGGRSSITGNFSVQEASDLASMLEIGKLPARVRIVQEANVGPSLGKENIKRSFTSLVAGLGLVLLFMVFYYGGAGIVSILALLLNLFFIFGALASFGTVLTLPGIAGIVLTIGMAVDANVIIFERVREELRAGKSMLASIADGFSNSYSAIIDANVTTLLTATVLFYFGLGPIKGFATVLIVGVVLSLFTAVLLGRLMIDWWTVTKGRDISFWTPPTKNAFTNMNVDWIGKRKIAYVISGTLIVLGLASIFTKGFDLGVDFKGGYSYNVQLADGQNADIQQIRAGLTTAFGDEPVVKVVDSENTYNIITAYNINSTDDNAADDVVKKLYEGINGISGGNLDFEKFKSPSSENVTHVTSSSKVGPTIADDIKKSSFYAGTFALLLIFLYIYFRFNKWQYSLGAVGALFHDTLIVLGIFSLLHGVLPISMEVDQAFIAAILTVIGYSINDTVIVFDRIREYLGIYTDKDTDEVLNMAINSTFTRTVITSFTTILVLIILLTFGGGSIKGFAFAMVIGIVVGTYSSIFVATPLVRDLSSDLKPKTVKSAKKSFSRATSK